MKPNAREKDYNGNIQDAYIRLSISGFGMTDVRGHLSYRDKPWLRA